ncbi:hypothetical protein [Marinobacter bohaiensis]|nr:hypothetical protein [Marinobacter bohaiensis]
MTISDSRERKACPGLDVLTPSLRRDVRPATANAIQKTKKK